MGHIVNPALGHAFGPGLGHRRGERATLAEVRKTKGWTQEQAADAMGLSLGGYRKLEYGNRDFSLDYRERAARACDVPLGTFLDAARQEVPLVGYVGAGAEAHFYATADDPDETVPAPDNWTPNMVAVEIRGESLGELFDHWIVFYDQVKTPVTTDMIGKLCVVGLPDGRVLVKKIKASRAPGVYHLLSNTEAPILDVEIDWAAKVKTMVPR